MTVTAISCPTCQESVPYGRLSCPGCGELLASVAGVTRPPRDPGVSAVPVEAPAADPPPDDQPVALDADPGWEYPDTDAADGLAAASAEPAETVPHAVVEQAAEAPQPGTTPAAPTGPAPIPAELAWHQRPAAQPWAAKRAEAKAARMGAPDALDVDDEPFLEPEPEAYPARPAAAPASVALPAPDLASPPPSLGIATAVPMAPSGVHAQGSTFVAAGAVAGATDATVSEPTARRQAMSLTLPALRLGELPRHLVIAGATVAAISFVLPWGGTMLGAPSLGRPWISLGIMGSWHVLALLAVLGTVALAIKGTRVGPWLREGVVPLLVAGDLLGLAWPYLTTSLGRGIGAYAVLVGAVAMAVGAVLAIRAATRPAAPRNAEPSSSV